MKPWIALDTLSTVAHGVDRPEDVHVASDLRVFVSDSAAALSEIGADGSIRRIGHAGGEPNGFVLTADGRAVIANFALGVLQQLDLTTGRIETILEQVEGRPLGSVNYPVADRSGAIYVSTSTLHDPATAIATGAPDGFIFRLDLDGTVRVVADEVAWPNCMTFGDDERHLYVCRSAVADVARFEVLDSGRLGPPERYGPPLGERRPDEFGPDQLAAFGEPATLARWALTDGCAFDAEGNLWVTLLSANRIVAITPDLDVVTVVDDPGAKVLVAPTSIAFGGEDLRDVYFGSIASNYVVKGRSPIAGRPPRD
jgi:gluconolactonase